VLNPITFKSATISNRESLLSYAKELPLRVPEPYWLFRGMPSDFDLQTSLERVLVDAGIPLNEAPEIERKLLKEFKRRAHSYVDSLPADGDVLGWLALMQHYGAPTRLLDWTYSFFVAAFFALADAQSNPPDKRKPAVVWALFRDAFKLNAQAPEARTAYDLAAARSTWQTDVGRADADNIYDGINAYLLHIMEKPKRSIWAINPFRLNERLSVQQGVFLCPGDLTVSFEDNLKAGGPDPRNLVRFEISTEPNKRSEMLGALNRMNINYASLLPGLDGFCRSLKQSPWIAGKLRPNEPSHG
jgi:FRG domain